MASQSQQVLHIAGWNTCGFYKRANGVLTSLSLLFPSKLKVVDHSFPSRNEYRSWLVDGGFRSKFSDNRAHKHTSSPFVWFGNSDADDDILGFLGGHDDALGWSRTFCSPVDSKEEKVVMTPDGHTPDHTYDYDLVVIGGGSGGLAASKKAASHGAKVAVLDFVKPSPLGTTWGLGGTCVNVGCIPKKLMHYGSTLNEAVHADSKAFGISTVTASDHSWENMRENINNYVRGLNFKYRVELRDKNVTYLNKLGRFLDQHTLELTDKKGKVTQVTASRFIVATGGRPTPLDCPGGELAVSSDDIFFKETSPGKTLCVGASYISLECAGFLAGLGYDVTIAVRSILLRGFDRECADIIGTYMEANGIKFKNKNLPTKLEKIVETNKIKVTFTDGTSDEYDTVLVAIGRSADTTKLGLENVNIETVKAGKFRTKYEQTTTNNIYAVGDCMEGCPELTPVAIQAGEALANRLFGGSTSPMDYKNICTSVFTPIEYSTIGYSEDEAIELFTKDKIEVYHKSFTPLEWALSDSRQNMAFAKIIVDKQDNNKVIGMHYVGPNAGEVMQGFGVAMKKGITYEDLCGTVGIHPTTAEEFTRLTVTKSSGQDAAAGGC